MTMQNDFSDGIRHRKASSTKAWESNISPFGPSSGSFRKKNSSVYVPYVDRVNFARRKKPGSWTTVFIEVTLIVAALSGAVLAYLYADELHLNITRFYAKMGSTQAQNLLSQHLLQGAQTEDEIQEAVYWLRKAAKKGDPLANYNLVVAHLKQHAETEGLTMDEVKRMMDHAGAHGVQQAKQFLGDCKKHTKCAWLSNKLAKRQK
ncbi:Sel1 repeat protein [Opisthorchis viverrini]|uniref:Uncharacterized protein n=2 Tax=Opisthorchis viverrini TaxID=6198 RepID=A0A074ZDR5_OPIVI|nr:hypothetical protein T265_14568 [Opisthorchis viverrini]KER23767.1 hypothetical protein T265_14568 [Opisthorchis viverrini]OON21064.1 Sel1 repeat protein [Opisthorchis viverrini]